MAARAVVDLHCHTSASFDSLSDPAAVARTGMKVRDLFAARNGQRNRCGVKTGANFPHRGNYLR